MVIPNENPYPPSPAVEKALREMDLTRLRKYPDPAAEELTARLELGASLRVLLRFDEGPWLRVGELRGSSLRSLTLSVPTRRCQRLRLRLEGSGGMELHSLSWLTESGSDV